MTTPKKKIKKFAIKTLGCKVNQYEGEVIREKLVKCGLCESEAGDADILIVNSCTVTGRADSKTRQLIRKAKKENPKARIVVTGCYAVLPEDIELLESFPEVDKVIPGGQKEDVGLILKELDADCSESSLPFTGVGAFKEHTRAFLKVQDGCDQRCSYCKVNLVRGPSRSKDEDDVFKEMSGLVKDGYREIVLTGICLGSWRGKNGRTLADLLSRVLEIDGKYRIRISSIEPNYVDRRLIDVIAFSEKIARHLHIPLQSGSDPVLALMKRRYDANVFYDIVREVRAKMPKIGISMDVIAGFPGETEKDHEATKKFIRKVKPSRLHVFKYSDRKGTEAFKIKEKVKSEIAEKRVEEIISIGKDLQDEFMRSFFGRAVEVLIEEHTSGNLASGYTSEYVRTEISGYLGKGGELVTVKAALHTNGLASLQATC